MMRLRFDAIVAAVVLGLPLSAGAAVQLVPVLTGLSSPVFVGNAGDGSNRLFIVEAGGTIQVLQPGAAAPTVFLDIHSRIVAGGERGLLGLAFHPQYAANGRFFVFYTRSGDGALAIAEYQVSADPNVADPAERQQLLTIAHPNTNHNGGMLGFGPDGYLYIGVGDGGSADDPPDNAQNIDVLLGKILRIDIDPPSGAGYLSPPSNPFYGAIPGLDEIFAYGMRNPWRFSFDRLTGQQWVGDVGQGAREEVDTPVVAGANYGWRVYEGFRCTNNDPPLCNPANYTFPIFDYAHVNGRCSITGGYVYTGSQGVLPVGTYVFGDYCSGEIFIWDGTTQTVLLDTTMNISSFGEDEQGELYVINLGGTVSKLTLLAPCTYISSPVSAAFGPEGGSASITVGAPAGCPWNAASDDSWIHLLSGATGSGSGSVAYSVDANGSASPRSGSIVVAGTRRFAVSQSGATPGPGVKRRRPPKQP